jgi:uncharacterized protein (TIGR03000 family)
MQLPRWFAGVLLGWCVVVLPLFAQDDKTTAKIKVKVTQADAKLYIDDTLTKQTGLDRTFTTPTLEAGKKFSYTFKVILTPNNYTTITRLKEVFVAAGQTVEVDLTKADPAKPDDIFIRYVPTPPDIVKEMLKLGRVGPNDVVFDLGCGDGRMVIAAVAHAKAKRGVGIDLDPERLEECKVNVKAAGVEDKVTFRKGNVLEVKDISEASVVLLYMSNDLNLALRPMLQKSLKPGARIVSHRFIMGDWAPTKSITVKGEDGDEYKLHLWEIADKK